MESMPSDEPVPGAADPPLVEEGTAEDMAAPPADADEPSAEAPLIVTDADTPGVVAAAAPDAHGTDSEPSSAPDADASPPDQADDMPAAYAASPTEKIDADTINEKTPPDSAVLEAVDPSPEEESSGDQASAAPAEASQPQNLDASTGAARPESYRTSLAVTGIVDTTLEALLANASPTGGSEASETPGGSGRGEAAPADVPQESLALEEEPAAEEVPAVEAVAGAAEIDSAGDAVVEVTELGEEEAEDAAEPGTAMVYILCKTACRGLHATSLYMPVGCTKDRSKSLSRFWRVF